MATGASGEIDLIRGTKGDYGFFSSGTLTSCVGSANQFFPGNSDIVDLASGSAGLWFADAGRGSIWQYDGSCQGRDIHSRRRRAAHITEGSDGDVYFTTQGAVWEFIPSTGVFYDYTDPALVDPEGITLGSDGNIWSPIPTDTRSASSCRTCPPTPTGSCTSGAAPRLGQQPVPPVPLDGSQNSHLPPPVSRGSRSLRLPEPGSRPRGSLRLRRHRTVWRLPVARSDRGCADSDVPPSGTRPVPTSASRVMLSASPPRTDPTPCRSHSATTSVRTTGWRPRTRRTGQHSAVRRGSGLHPRRDAVGFIVDAGPPPVLPEVGAVRCCARGGRHGRRLGGPNRRRRTAAARRA